jgi:hypothetical protein
VPQPARAALKMSNIHDFRSALSTTTAATMITAGEQSVRWRRNIARRVIVLSSKLQLPKGKLKLEL